MSGAGQHPLLQPRPVPGGGGSPCQRGLGTRGLRGGRGGGGVSGPLCLGVLEGAGFSRPPLTPSFLGSVRARVCVPACCLHFSLICRLGQGAAGGPWELGGFSCWRFQIELAAGWAQLLRPPHSSRRPRRPGGAVPIGFPVPSLGPPGRWRSGDARETAPRWRVPQEPGRSEGQPSQARLGAQGPEPPLAAAGGFPQNRSSLSRPVVSLSLQVPLLAACRLGTASPAGRPGKGASPSASLAVPRAQPRLPPGTHWGPATLGGRD